MDIHEELVSKSLESEDGGVEHNAECDDIPVERVGKRALLMMLGSLLLIPVCLMMAYMRPASYVTVYLPPPITGLSPSLPITFPYPGANNGYDGCGVFAHSGRDVALGGRYIVDHSKLGTAYGVMTMIQNIGLAGFNLLMG